MEVWFRSFSFQNGWFVGSMLIFQGVVETTRNQWMGGDVARSPENIARHHALGVNTHLGVCSNFFWGGRLGNLGFFGICSNSFHKNKQEERCYDIQIWAIGKMKRPESGLSLEASLLVFRLRFAKLWIILSIIGVQSPWEVTTFTGSAEWYLLTNITITSLLNILRQHIYIYTLNLICLNTIVISCIFIYFQLRMM